MELILPYQKQFQIDYRSERLPALFSKQESDADFGSALLQIEEQVLKERVSESRLTLLIACEQLRNQLLIQAIKEQADKGIRIYLLLGKKAANQVAIDTLSGRCLIRSGVSQRGALMLVDHTTSLAQGLLMMSADPLGSSHELAWGIQLEPQQVDDSFRSFCKLFWENSNEEYIQQNHPQRSVKHPDGGIVTNHSHQLFGTLKEHLNDTLEQLDAATHTGFGAAGDRWRLLLARESSDLESQARPGVALTENRVPSLLLSSDGNWLLPDQPDFTVANWCLKLSVKQGKQIDQVYDQAFEKATWQYKHDPMVGEFSAQQRLRFVDQPNLECVVQKVRKIELSEINTESIDSFLDDDAEQLASAVIGWQRSQLAHFINYTVMIHPPYCPVGAKKDPLYSAWKESEENWQQRLEKLTQIQTKIDQEQASITDKLKGFIKGFLLGQGQSVKLLNQEINSLRAWSVTRATPAERTEFLRRLESLQSKIHQRKADTEQELDKAKQNDDWEQKRVKLSAELADMHELLNRKSSALKMLEINEDDNRSSVEEAFTKQLSEAIEKLTEQQLSTMEINGIRSDQFLKEPLPEIPKSAPKQFSESERKERNIEIEEAKRMRDELQAQAAQAALTAKREALTHMSLDEMKTWKQSISKKVWSKHYIHFERCLANHLQGMNKIERDLQQAQKDLDKAEADYKRAEQTLDEHGTSFIYHPQQVTNALAKVLDLNSKQSKQKQSEQKQFQWPKEELPTDGSELYRDQQERYLVIKYQEQIAQAKLDAKRLSAKIVCDKESSNA